MPQAITLFFANLGLSALAAAIASAVVQVAIAVGLNVLVNSIFGPSRPKPSDGQLTVRASVGSRRRHYGIVHTGGQLSFLESRNGTLGKVITLGTGEEEGTVIEHRINDRPVTVDGSGTVTDASFHGALHIHTRHGTDDQSGIAELTASFAEWTSDHRQRGCSLVALIGDPVEQDQFSEVYNGREPEYTQIRKAVKIYDPRKDDTQQIGTDGSGDPVYGSGAHRIDDKTTREWSDNWALVTADYFAHPDGYGGGFDNVNWANIAAEADICDETETTITAEEIPRWRIWASYSLASEERKQVLTEMIKAADGFCWQDADLKFNLISGRFEEPDIIITDDHIKSMTATLGPKAQHRTSAIKVLYTEAAIGYREQESALIEAVAAEDDPNTDPQALEAYFVPHHNQAIRVGKPYLRRLGERWHLSLVLNLYGLNLLGTRFCRVESQALGVSAYFIIAGGPKHDRASKTIEVTLDQVEPDDWDLDAATEEGTPPNMAVPPSGIVTVPVPSGIALTAVQIALGETNAVAIAATWDDPGRAGLSFEAQYRPSAGGDWVSMVVDSQARNAHSGPVDSGAEYEVRVRALTIGLRTSDWSVAATITPVATNALQPPSDLSAIPGAAGEADISWRNPVQADFDHVKIFENSSSDLGTAAQIGGEFPGGLGELKGYAATGLASGTHYFWGISYDASGNASGAAGPVSAIIS